MSGSAGTLEVTLGARTSPLVAGMKNAEDALKRFGRTAETVAGQSSAGWERFGRGIRPALGAAAASMAMVAGESNDTAGAIARVTTAGLAANQMGGKWAAGITVITMGIREWMRAEASAAESRAKIHKADMDRLEAHKKAREDFLAGQDRATAIASGAATADDLEASDAFMAGGDSAADAVRRRQMAEQWKAARATIEADRAAERRATLGEDSPIVKGMERQAEIDKIRAEYAADIADRIIAGKEALWDAVDAAERYKEAQEDIEESKRRQKKADDEMAAAEADREGMLRRIVERRRDEAKEAERARDRMREINDAFDARLRMMAAGSDLERMQLRNVEAYRDAIEAGVAPAKALEEASRTTAEFMRQEAEDARKAADADAERALAHERMTFEARNRAEAEKAASDAAARSAQINAYGAGNGPLAQARDAKRRNRNIDKNLRTEANLAAEARESMAYGNVGATQYDAAGNPIGSSDPFASDLGSLMNRPKKAKPQYDNLAPGLFTPAYDPGPAAPSQTDIFGPLGAAGDSVKAGGDATMDAAGKVTEAAADMTTGADDIATGSGEIADGIATAAEGIGRAAEAVTNVVAVVETLNDRVATLEAALAAATFYGG